MSAWGTGNYENDAASDWLVDFKKYHSFDFIKTTLQATIDFPYDSWINEQAIGAAEVLCIIKGNYDKDFDIVSFEEWMENNFEKIKEQEIPADILGLALKVVEAVEEHSEAKDLWLTAGGDLYFQWCESLKFLKKRLQL